MISIASPSRYSSFTSLETVVYFVYEDVIEGNFIIESCKEWQWANIASTG
jgi:hypothetical protein